MFDTWSFSDETGWFKPAAEAFVPALQGLGVEAAETAHVGDSRRTDVAGARSLGMVAVRFTGFHDRPPDTGPEADHVIDDHRTLPVLLGVA
jgi:FMN phosphatase YigB (HAD superfamily)